MELDHAGIVTSHACNGHYPFCIDKFVHTSGTPISVETVGKFLEVLKKHTDKPLEILLLGGDPSVLAEDRLIAICNKIHEYGFKALMSTNGILKDKIIRLLPYFDSVQITAHNDEEIDFWRPYADKINIKWSGDMLFNYKAFKHFIKYSKGFSRRSVSMYFKPDFTELCTDEKIWKKLNKLDWKRNGSYEYAFYKGVRFKKGIHGETNIIDEPCVPKVYPNGNYSKTWNNEDLDDYLTNGEW